MSVVCFVLEAHLQRASCYNSSQSTGIALPGNMPSAASKMGCRARGQSRCQLYRAWWAALFSSI